MPVAPFLALIEANRVDQAVTRYETFDDLLGYCELSAAPIGQIVLHIAGAARPDNIADSDAACAALQILEHCQDVGEDARAGRIYLPHAELRAAGVADDDLLAATTSPALRGVIAVQVRRSRELLGPGLRADRAPVGMAHASPSRATGRGPGDGVALRAAEYDVLGHDVVPGSAGPSVHAVRLAVGGER